MHASCGRWLSGHRGAEVEASPNDRDWQDSAVTIRAADGDAGSMLLRVRVSIVGSEPVIWRLLDVDSSLTLDCVHHVIQTAVGWRDAHLHSFTDTDPYKRLRPVNGEIPEPRRWVSHDLLGDDEDDLPEADWSLGQILPPGSGPLFYEYDFGDAWIHRLELVDSRPMPVNAPRARLLDGALRGAVGRFRRHRRLP
jgi:hypothetical protein